MSYIEMQIIQRAITTTLCQCTALQGRHFCRSNWNLEKLDFRRVVEADNVDTIMLTNRTILFKHQFSNREREFNLFYFID